jgi:S1-C subfamily serine protease
MFWSAASLILTVAITGSNDLSERELRAWKKVQPSIVQLIGSGEVRGSAALISTEGLFIAHVTAAPGKESVARTSGGRTVRLTKIASDDPTQFVLLKADVWMEDAPALTISDSSAERSILAVTPTGPIRAEVSNSIYGIVDPSRRVVQMNEIRLENNMRTLGGSLLVNLNGQLVGALDATLGPSPEQTVQRAKNDLGTARGGGLGGGGTVLPSRAGNALQFGPGILTAAYSVGPKVLRRVVAGFLSSTHEVKHPAIGVFCRDAVPLGALVVSVTKGSKAEDAGMREGDIIVSINGRSVRNQIEFAQIMADQEIGETLTMWIQRSGLRQQLKVEVGSQP